jgi:hypothetical protein
MVCRRLRLTSGGLGEFKSADEFKLIHDEAAKMQAYGRVAGPALMPRLSPRIYFVIHWSRLDNGRKRPKLKFRAKLEVSILGLSLTGALRGFKPSSLVD